MNIKKIYWIFMLVFLMLVLGTTISYGAYSASSSTVESGGKITVKVTSSDALEAYNLDLKSYDGLTFNSCSKTESGAIININGSSIGYMNMSGSTKELGTYTFTAPKVTEDKKYTITFVVDKNTTVSSTITVKAPVEEVPSTNTKPEKPSTNTNTNTETNTETKKSSEARLKNFGINPEEYDFSGFKKDITEYSVEVPNKVTSVEVYAKPLDNKAKVVGDGTVTLNEGKNKIGVKVTAEDGTTKTYTLTIKRKTEAEENAENGENRLKSLSITPKEYDFTGFESDKTEYTAKVPNKIEQIEIEATAIDSKAQITGTGVIDLKEGENELKIEVIAVNGDKKVYTIVVTRLEAEEKFGLSILSINGLKLSPTFMTGIYEYTTTLEEDLTQLEITAKSNVEDATIEIVGNENLQSGENVITILVKNKKTDETATYQILVNKQVKVETAEIVEKTSWLKPSTWGKEEIIKIAIIIVIIILIVCSIILKINISKEDKKSKNVDLPGAKELDRAMSEHQELVEEKSIEESDNTVDEYKMNINNNEQNYIEEIAKNRFETMDSIEEKPKKRGKHF